jgi:prephenate dehydrogenase
VKRPRVAICGLGLVGGSLARALSARGYVVIGVDRPSVVRRARAARAIARALGLGDAAAEADVLVLAAPPGANLRLLRRVAALRRPGLAVTDVTSVKGPIVAEARRLGLPGFVGGHPMAGRERSGFGAATATLFQGRSWILVPGRDAWALRRVRRLVRDAGARPVAMSAAAHDRVVARLSHLPQLVAWALLAAARSDAATRRGMRFAGPGFHDMTRLARSPKGLWREILRSNRVEVERALASLRAALPPRGLWR